MNIDGTSPVKEYVVNIEQVPHLVVKDKLSLPIYRENTHLLVQHRQILLKVNRSIFLQVTAHLI